MQLKSRKAIYWYRLGEAGQAVFRSMRNEKIHSDSNIIASGFRDNVNDISYWSNCWHRLSKEETK